MIPDKDYYADKNGKLTDDPNAFAFQIALKGVYLDAGVAKRYGIENVPTSTDGPKRSKASVQIHKAKEQEESASVVDDKPETDEPEAEEPKAAASTPTVAKEEGKKK